MPKMKWEDPPVGQVKRQGAKERIDQEVLNLQKRPGRWAKVRTKASAGTYLTYKNRGCEVRVKSVGNNKYDIWARWVPEGWVDPEVPASAEEERNG